MLLLVKLDALAPPGESRDGDIPGFSTQEWVDFSVRVGVALTGILLSSREMDTTIIDFVVDELERAETKFSEQHRTPQQR